MPDTLYFDDLGWPHGTGIKRYVYESGKLKIAESYLAGNLQTSRWYRPDGSLVEQTRWKSGTGIGICLRDDGTIESRYEYVNGVANGLATYYAEDGSVERVASFRDGVKVTDEAENPVPAPDGGS
jgi:antitoxin component YwqK of YwqJK toxin-antitoxin module